MESAAHELPDRLVVIGRVRSSWSGTRVLDAVMAMTGASFADGRLRLHVTDGPQVVRLRAGERELVAEAG